MEPKETTVIQAKGITVAKPLHIESEDDEVGDPQNNKHEVA
jgi:hypothetical protein